MQEKRKILTVKKTSGKGIVLRRTVDKHRPNTPHTQYTRGRVLKKGTKSISYAKTQVEKMEMQSQCNNRKYSPLKGKLEQELFLKEQLSKQTARLQEYKRIAEGS